MMNENTVDVKVDIYSSAMEDNFRWVVLPDPDFPKGIVLQYQELESGIHSVKDSISFDPETWEKIKYAVDLVIEKTI